MSNNVRQYLAGLGSRTVLLACVQIARLGLVHIPSDETRPRELLDLLERGGYSSDELWRTREAAWSSHSRATYASERAAIEAVTDVGLYAEDCGCSDALGYADGVVQKTLFAAGAREREDTHVSLSDPDPDRGVRREVEECLEQIVRILSSATT